MLDLLTPNKPLQPLNTLALPATAAYYLPAHSEVAVAEALLWCRERELPLLVLGGGSNVVLDGDWPGLVLHICIPGITRLDDDEEGGVLVRVGAGENWDAFVHYALDQGWFGLENLVSIPGSVGAAPIQNIGAYGVELSRFLVGVAGYEVDTGEPRQMSAAQCELGYRDSVFKQRLRNRFVITEVTLRLQSRPQPELGYKGMAEAFPDPVAVSPAQLAAHIAEVRAEKLPDPGVLPNAGSFFKNPVVSASQFEVLQRDFPQMVAWSMPDGGYKLAAAWLVEQCGWKGRRVGACGVHERQSIVLVNHAGADSAELLALAQDIAGDVKRLFDVALEIEPAVYRAADVTDCKRL